MSMGATRRSRQGAVVVAAVAVGSCLLPATSAGAAPPDISTQTVGPLPTVPYIGPNLPCPNGTTILLQNLILNFRFIRFTDSGGTLVREIRHVSFTGDLTNATTGKTIPYRGKFTRTQDFQAGTVTTTGLTRQTHLPGRGAVLIGAGREVTPNDPDDVATAAGRPLGTYNADVCSYLAS